MFDDGIEKNITIHATSDRESVFYTSVGHALTFQLIHPREDAKFLVHYQGTTQVTNA